jgi:hypothetical protein
VAQVVERLSKCEALSLNSSAAKKKGKKKRNAKPYKVLKSKEEP